ncbi:MAG: hypothetical protein J5726_08670 [Treponema sp.]|nr:hypothetical protein [Treponema sp.]
MKNLFYICILLFILLFSSCIAIPGYIDDNGNITAPYSEEIIVEAVSGTLIIIPTETSKGPQNINPAKNEALKTQKKETIYLSENKTYCYSLEGNHSITFAFRTIADESTFKITYRHKTTEYIIHSTDFCDKFVYIENY